MTQLFSLLQQESETEETTKKISFAAMQQIPKKINQKNKRKEDTKQKPQHRFECFIIILIYIYEAEVENKVLIPQHLFVLAALFGRELWTVHACAQPPE